jgi:hypothetical protein
MRKLGSQLSLLTLGLLALCAVAQESPPPAQAPTPPAQSPAPPAPSPVPPQASSEASDDVFIPTEELAADEEVTFPVDI